MGPGLTTIHADRRRLERVLNNLFSNALEFTPPGGTVELGAALEGAEVKIWLKNTGVGIAQGTTVAFTVPVAAALAPRKPARETIDIPKPRFDECAAA
jgi:cell cycle sensor histidine kinase DivJ